MKKFFVAVAAGLSLFTPVLSAQHFKVGKLQRVVTSAPMGAFHPVFSPDGKNLLVTAEDYSGLGVVDLQTKKYKFLTAMEGAGYKAAFAEDASTVVVRENDLDNQTMSLYAVDIQTGINEKLVGDIEHTNSVSIRRGSLNYSQKGRLRTKGVATRRHKAAATPAFEDVFVTEEDLKIVVYRNGVRNVLDPLSTPDNDVNYCWTELSPDKKKIVFVAGQSAYTCGIDGSDLKNIGDIRAPKWRDNRFIVGMNDEDDGHELKSSDIVIVREDGAFYQQLTVSDNEIKMFPSVSPDGNTIAFNTTKGEIYLMTISENQ